MAETVIATSSAVFPFDHPHALPARELGDLLGGKGAGLAEMTAALGIAVPPGFTITLPVCRAYREHGWPPDLDAAVDEQLRALETRMRRGFGDPTDPLLVAVRSGAPVSMPGMLDTVLNLGLNDDTVLGLARVSGDGWFAWDCYRRFLVMFACTVMDVPDHVLDVGPAGDTEQAVRATVGRLRERITAHAGRDVPTDARQQLREAVEAVFRSWDCTRAQAYRAKEGIDADMGTAVNVQAMVFGNRGPGSGTGVVFTRDPATGEAVPYGDYLPCAQGEDVVAGTARTMPIAHLGEHHPAVNAELLTVLRRLEVHYRDLCDVEFTVEDGRLWLLQTRVGKRGAVAAVRSAVEFVRDPDVALTPAEAVERVPAEVRARARAEVLARTGATDVTADLLDTGLGASPGRVTGRVVLSSDAAADAEADVVLVRRETSPEDVAGMAASVGILTTRGGLVSHAAVVARGWGIPAVVGAAGITWAADRLVVGDRVVAEGDVITIDGATGQVWAGEVTAAANGDGAEATLARELPELAVLEGWAAAL